MIKKISITFWSFIFSFFALSNNSKAFDILDIDINWSIDQAGNSTYFDPSVAVSLEVCIKIDLSFFETSICIPSWNNNKTLDAYGECRFMLPYPIRVCARTYTKDFSTDPAPDNAVQDTTKTMLCVFNDPMFPIDLNDFNPDRMRHGHNTKVEKSFTNPVQVGVGTAILASGVVPGVGTAVAGAYLMYEGIKNLIDLIGSTINYTVISNLGCVDIPFAPMPPFYTGTLPLLKQAPMLFNICQRDSTGNVLLPGDSNLGDTLCEFASSVPRNSSTDDTTNIFKKFNTHENPSIVLSFKNIIQKCKPEDINGAPGILPKECVTIFNEAKYLNNVRQYMSDQTNTLTNNLLLQLKGCDYSGLEPAFCIQNNTNNDIQIDRLFRPLCNITTLDGKFDAENTQCSLIALKLDSSSAIAAVTGIDYSNFYQVPVYIKAGESTINNSFGQITDMLDGTNSMISLKMNSNDPNNIEIYQKFSDRAMNKIGSFIRPTMPKPVVQFFNTTTFHTNPGLSVSLGSPAQKANITYGIKDKDQAYLYLNKFTLSVIDKNNSGTAGNAYGNYRKKGSFTKVKLTNEHLIKARINLSTPDKTSYGDGSEFIYMDGIEFIDNKYIRGGEYVCLEGYKNPEKVLALKQSLISKNTSADSTTSASSRLSDRIYPPYNPNVIDLGADQFIETKFKKTATSTYIESYGTMVNNSLIGDERYKINDINQAVRYKLPIESNLCVKIKKPQCPQILEKKAIWNPVDFSSSIIEAQCLNNDSRKITRLCQLKKDDNNTAEWSEINGTCNDWWPDPSGSGKFLNFASTTNTDVYSLEMTRDTWIKFLNSTTENNLYKSLKDNNNTRVFFLSFKNLIDNNLDLSSKNSTIKLKEYLLKYTKSNDTNIITIYRKDDDLYIETVIFGYISSKNKFEGIFSPENIADNVIFE